MDTITNMRSLVTVARYGSFSAAARELSLSTAMVSKHVKQLEERLDVRLLNRTTRGVSLTEPGALYCQYATDILDKVQECTDAVQALNSKPRGALRISCPPSFGEHVLTHGLSQYIRENPEISVELGVQDDLPDMIGGRLDLSIRFGQLADSSLIAKKIGDASFVLCASPTYEPANKSPFELKDLSAANCLIDTSIHDKHWDVRVGNKKKTVPVSGNFRSLSTEAVVQAAIDGLGIAYVPSYAAQEDIDRGLLKLVESEFKVDSMPIYAVYLGRKHLPEKTRSFIRFLTAWLKKDFHIIS
ncbi:MAG: LysR family transcriptional regulator [Gammaproteobacteria bacterium]